MFISLPFVVKVHVDKNSKRNVKNFDQPQKSIHIKNSLSVIIIIFTVRTIRKMKEEKTMLSLINCSKSPWKRP